MSIRGVLIRPDGGEEIVHCDQDDMFESIKKTLGNPRIIGMAPKCVKNTMYEFWYDDTGDQYDANAQNEAMERLLGGGFYGPGLLLERRNDTDTMCGDDYGDILANWNKTHLVYEYLCTLLGVKKHRTPEQRAQRKHILIECLNMLKTGVEDFQMAIEDAHEKFLSRNQEKISRDTNEDSSEQPASQKVHGDI